jgi:hypothetical protein
MGKGIRNKKQPKRPVVLQRTTPPTPPIAPAPQHKPLWKKIPGWLWKSISACAVVVGLFVLYPSLSVNEDYSFDTMFPYNTSFSITNEGFWPIADLSATCSADFVMRPWPSPDAPDDQSSMNLHTREDEYKDFAKSLNYKQRVTLPCNHNVVANGHRIDPGAKLDVIVTYRFLGTHFHREQRFDFRTVMGSNGQSYWQYQ